jgi:hypothetical protein
VLLSAGATGLPKDSVANVSQVVTLDKTCLPAESGRSRAQKLSFSCRASTLFLGAESKGHVEAALQRHAEAVSAESRPALVSPRVCGELRRLRGVRVHRGLPPSFFRWRGRSGDPDRPSILRLAAGNSLVPHDIAIRRAVKSRVLGRGTNFQWRREAGVTPLATKRTKV